MFSTLVAVPALIALTACAGAAPTQPTVQAVATQAVGTVASGAATVQAGASPAATAMAGASPAAATAIAAASPALGTAQAAASPAAATMQAGAAPVLATSASIAGTAVGSLPAMASPSPSPAAQAAPLRIADASLADATPWLSLQNDGDSAIDVSVWQLQVGSASAELPANAVVEPRSSLTVHAGSGQSNEDDVYLGDMGGALVAAAMPGAPVRLTNERGQVVAEVSVPRF